MTSKFRRLVVAVIFLGTSSSAFAASKPTGLPAVLEKLEVKYTKEKTLEADFVQVNDSATTQQKKKSSGKITIKRPMKLKWETLEPEKNLLVSNGKVFWFYTPPYFEDEKGQVIQRKSTEVQSKLANALLSGSFSMARDMKIDQKSPTQFVLVPKKGSAGTVERAEIEIDTAAMLIRGVKLYHAGGNRSEIKLSNIVLGKPAEDSLFEFVAPPNTDRLDP